MRNPIYSYTIQHLVWICHSNLLRISNRRLRLKFPEGQLTSIKMPRWTTASFTNIYRFIWPAVLCITSSEVLSILAADDLLVVEVTAEADHRAGARSRSARLTGPQFQRLSTDCYEDLLWKTRVGERKMLAPHLPVDGPTAVPTRIKDDTYATVPKHGAREAVGAPAAALHGHAE